MSEIRVENIIGETGVDAVKFTKGINVTGIVTATNVSIGSSVTATNFFGSGAGLSGVSAGKILQVVESSAISSQVTTSSTTFQDTGISVSITPSASTSKILVLAVGSAYIQGTGYNVKGEIRVLRDSTEITRTDHGYDSANSSFGARLALSFNMSRLDAPNTTSSITYKTQIRVAGTNYSPDIRVPSLFNNTDGGKYGGSRIQLLEVAVWFTVNLTHLLL